MGEGKLNTNRRQRWKKTADIYKILDGSITYDYSKKD